MKLRNIFQVYCGEQVQKCPMTKSTELRLSLSLESRSCSTVTQAIWALPSQGRAGKTTRQLVAKTITWLILKRRSSRKKMSVWFGKGRGLWHSKKWGNGVNPPEDVARGSKHNCSPPGPCTGHQEPFLTERLLDTGMRCSGGWGDLHSWQVWILLSRFPSAGMKVTGPKLNDFHRPGSMKVFTPLWLEERERQVALHPLP